MSNRPQTNKEKPKRVAAIMQPKENGADGSKEPDATGRTRLRRNKKKPLNPGLKSCENVLTELFSKEHSSYAYIFYDPVEGLPDYHDIIQEPMDMKTVRRKLNDRQYSSVSGFKKDIMQMIHNCKKYYEDPDEILDMAVKFETIFLARMKEIEDCFSADEIDTPAEDSKVFEEAGCSVSTKRKNDEETEDVGVNPPKTKKARNNNKTTAAKVSEKAGCSVSAKRKKDEETEDVDVNLPKTKKARKYNKTTAAKDMVVPKVDSAAGVGNAAAIDGGGDAAAIDGGGNAAAIDAKIKSYGYLYRKLKSEEADKPEIEAVWKDIVNAKAEYKAATGLDWKLTLKNPQTAAKPGSGGGDDLSGKVAAQNHKSVGNAETPNTKVCPFPSSFIGLTIVE